MVDSNSKAADFIQKIELYYNTLLEKLHTTQEALIQARFEAQTNLESLNLLQEKTISQSHTVTKDTLIPQNDSTVISPILDVPHTNTNILDLEVQIATLKNQNETLEAQYQKTYQSLQKEMLKVDTMQMELELLQRERDIALRKQALSSEQKQLLVKLEYENYRINETIERVDYISNTLKTILGDKIDTDNQHQNFAKPHISELQ